MVGDFEEDDIHCAIKRVFQLIVESQNPTKDDTCFKKLLDLIRQWVLSPQAVKNSGCLELLSCVTSKPVEDSVLVFTVELAGTLIEVKAVDEQNSNLIEELLCHAFSLISTDSPSLGTPFFNTLRTLLIHEYQTRLLVKCEGLLTKCWSILDKGKSIFYTNAVVNFLKVYVVSKHCYSPEELENFLYKIENQLNRAKDNITPSSQNDQLTSSCLRLMVLYPDCVKTTKAVKQLVESLETIVCMQTSPSVWSLAVDVLLTFSKKFGAEFPVCIETVNNLPAKIAVSDFCKCQKVCNALLESGFVEHKEEVMKLMLCPLNSLYTDASGADNSHSLALKQMNDKDRCIKLLWTTLDSIDRLHYLPDTALESIITLFRLTFDKNVGNTVGSHIRAHIANCRKIQLKCCEVFKHKETKDEGFAYRIGRHIFMLISTQRLDNTLYSKCMDVFCNYLPSLLRQLNNKANGGSEIAEDGCDGQQMYGCVQRHLCDTEWEIRDTTLEFIKNVVVRYPDDEVVSAWITEGKLCLHVMTSLHDSNSYVRATAIQCLASIVNGRFLQILLQQGEISLAAVVGRVLSILTQDTEAFPRRAAMYWLMKCWNQIKMCGEDTETCVYTTLTNSASVDFDWEVKLRTVQFWDGRVQELLNGPFIPQLPSYAVHFKQSTTEVEDGEEKLKAAVHKLKDLYKIGCLDSLLKLLDDYDQSVCKEACSLLIKIKENFLQISTANSDGSEPPAKKIKSTVREAVKAAGATDKEQSVYHVISTLNLDEKFREFSVTCDEYDRNPLSLLQDITAHIQAVEKPEEENVVDCY